MLHGGAGSMKSMDDPRERMYRAALREAAVAGAAILDGGGSAVDAVVTVNVVMEDSGVFNAGLGSGLTADGRIEMDAAVMDGTEQDYGAVAAVEGVANPVVLARHVLDDTPHCMLVGRGAEAFGASISVPLRPDFPSAPRIAEWERRKALMSESTGSLADQLAALGGVLGDASSDKDSDGPVGQADTGRGRDGRPGAARLGPDHGRDLDEDARPGGRLADDRGGALVGRRAGLGVRHRNR